MCKSAMTKSFNTNLAYTWPPECYLNYLLLFPEKNQLNDDFIIKK